MNVEWGLFCGIAVEGTSQEEGGEEGDEAGEARSGEGVGDSPVHLFDNKGVKSICGLESTISEGDFKASKFAVDR